MENDIETQPRFFNKKNIIIVLGIIGAAIFIFAFITIFRGLSNLEKTANQTNKTQKTVVKKSNPAFLYFSPPSIKLQNNSQSNFTSDLILDTQEGEVSVLQIEISYDPKIISNVAISKNEDNIFSKLKVLQTIISQEKGKAFLALAIDEKEETPVKGKGKIAVLKYDIANTKGGSETLVEITPLTVLMTKGKEVKFEITNLTINFPANTSSLAPDAQKRYEEQLRLLKKQ